jgi:hypothetical protein
MRWQEVAFSAGSIIFCIGLIPMLRAESKPPLTHPSLRALRSLYMQLLSEA